MTTYDSIDRRSAPDAEYTRIQKLPDHDYEEVDAVVPGSHYLSLTHDYEEAPVVPVDSSQRDGH